MTNPGSGRKALYVASQNTMWIEGMDRDESEALLEKLFAIAEDPSIVYEHVWRPGDLIIWDNLACLHARTDWPSEQRRTLRTLRDTGEISDEAYHRLEEEIDWAELNAAPAGHFQPLTTDAR